MNKLKQYSKLIKDLSFLEGVYASCIFGSYAKNKQTKKSDVDICFFINPNNQELENELLSYKTDELDITIFHRIPPSVQIEILLNNKLLHIKDETLYREMKKYFLRKYKDESWVYKNTYFKRYGVKL